MSYDARFGQNEIKRSSITNLLPIVANISASTERKIVKPSNFSKYVENQVLYVLETLEFLKT